MKTELLYFYDSYVKEFEAKILDVKDSGLVLDKTAFYPEGGGQPGDNGTIIINDKTFAVLNTVKDQDQILHVLSSPVPKEYTGKACRGMINWNRRYQHMRYHTAIHILSGLFFKNYKARITGSQIYENKARMDVNYEGLNRELLPSLEEETNKIISASLLVTVRFLDKSSVDLNSLVRVKTDLIPNDLEKMRVIDIENFDFQADGGTHVKNTNELKSLKITKFESKGKENKRMYIVLE